MWSAAYGAMSRTDEAGLDTLPDGSLWQIRAAYEAETAWAPRYVGAELRQRVAERADAHLEAG